MHVSHPAFGEFVTSNTLVRRGRSVFRGAIVPLEDVFADMRSGLTVEEVSEKRGGPDRCDLEAVVVRALAADELVTISCPGTKRRVARGRAMHVVRPDGLARCASRSPD